MPQAQEVRFYDFGTDIKDEHIPRRSSLSPTFQNADLPPPADADIEEPESQTQLQTQLADGPYPTLEYVDDNVAKLWGRLHPCTPDYPTFDLARAKNVYTIGRHKSCDFAISSPKVSSVHCTITFHEADEVVTVQDHSRNGTYVRILV